MSEVHAALARQIELRQGFGCAAPKKFLGDILLPRVHFYNRVHFFTPVFKMLKMVHLHLIGYQIYQFSYFEIEPHELMLSWSGKYLVYTIILYLSPLNNLIIYNGEQKTLDMSFAIG